jgi:hypothetical protein
MSSHTISSVPKIAHCPDCWVSYAEVGFQAIYDEYGAAVWRRACCVCQGTNRMRPPVIVFCKHCNPRQELPDEGGGWKHESDCHYCQNTDRDPLPWSELGVEL